MPILISNTLFRPSLLHLVFLLSAATFALATPDGQALIAFKNALHDPNNVLRTWDPSFEEPCTYFYVTCDRDNRVTELYLESSNLSGKLVPELGKLDRLTHLELNMNKLEGSIPEELGGLKSLVSLDLYNNNLTGPIPSSLSKLSNLRYLRLNNNRLSGCVPEEVAKLPNLMVLDVSNNNLSGNCSTSGSSNKFRN